MLVHLDPKNIDLKLLKDFSENVNFTPIKLPGKSLPSYYLNQSYLYKQRILNLDSFAKDSFNHSRFLEHTMKEMTIEERGKFLLDLLQDHPTFANRISSFLNKPFIVNNEDLKRLLNWYISPSKEQYLDNIFKYNPQVWSITDLSETTKKSEKVLSFWENSKDIYNFSTPLKSSM